MSVNYAAGLSPYPGKGKCGLPEHLSPDSVVEEQVRQLAEFMRTSKHTVFHTGAGISTAAGIPDFRGPNGVWTLEQKGLEPKIDVTFDAAVPTFTHRAITMLEKLGLVHFVITQNVDGLHLRSGFPRERLAILHGDMFLEECDSCGALFVRDSAVNSLAQRHTGGRCNVQKAKAECRGKLRDTVLDWEANLPEVDLRLAEEQSRRAELSVTWGSSLQILPSSNFPTYVKKRLKTKTKPADWPTHPGHLVIVNLQSTRHDKLADIVIHSYVDKVMQLLCTELDVLLPLPAWTGPVFQLRSQSNPGKGRLPWKVVHRRSTQLLEDEDKKSTPYNNNASKVTEPSNAVKRSLSSHPSEETEHKNKEMKIEEPEIISSQVLRSEECVG